MWVTPLIYVNREPAETFLRIHNLRLKT
jgi:hypothetical protein